VGEVIVGGQFDRFDICAIGTAMLVTFFQQLKSAGVPVTPREHLTLMQADLASRRVEDFY